MAAAGPVSMADCLIAFAGLFGLGPGHYDPHDDPAILNDLLDIGPRKPLGYLPYETLRRHGQDPVAFRRMLECSGISTQLFSSRKRLVMQHLYAYHEPSLQRLLDAHRRVLVINKWPSTAKEFVRKVAHVTADEPHLYRLIGRAFNDQRPTWPIANVMGPNRREAEWP